jgi:parvulin-like peptidyl-prolyl isomerase
MAKEPANKSPKELTKKHQARLEKENRQKKFLTIGIIAIGIIIVALIVYGILSTTVLKDSKAVAKVGDTTITVKQFEDRVSYDRYQEIQTFQSYATSYFASFFQDQLVSIQNSLDSYVQFGSDTLDQMTGEIALVKKAKSMGITVTDQEVEDYIQSQLQYYPSGTPTTVIPTATITYFPTSTLSELQKTLTFSSPTPTATLEITPTNTPSSAEMTSTSEGTPAVELPSATATMESPTETPTVEASPSATDTITPTATEYTYSGYQNLYSTIVADTAANASFSETELRNYIRTVLYEQKVYNQVAAAVAPEQDMVWARHILVADEATATDVENQLKAGGDWNTLAAKYSTDTSNNTTGGDLGWFTKGTMVKEFEDAAWSMQVGATSDPIKTDYGFHIIQVLGHETRQLTSDELATAQKAAYQQFVTDAKAALTITKYDIWASVVPQIPTIPADYRISTTATP